MYCTYCIYTCNSYATSDVRATIIDHVSGEWKPCWQTP